MPEMFLRSYISSSSQVWFLAHLSSVSRSQGRDGHLTSTSETGPSWEGSNGGGHWVLRKVITSIHNQNISAVKKQNSLEHQYDTFCSRNDICSFISIMTKQNNTFPLWLNQLCTKSCYISFLIEGMASTHTSPTPLK